METDIKDGTIRSYSLVMGDVFAEVKSQNLVHSCLLNE